MSNGAHPGTLCACYRKEFDVTLINTHLGGRQIGKFFCWSLGEKLGTCIGHQSKTLKQSNMQEKQPESYFQG